jgi:hypothetical protein
MHKKRLYLAISLLMLVLITAACSPGKSPSIPAAAPATTTYTTPTTTKLSIITPFATTTTSTPPPQTTTTTTSAQSFEIASSRDLNGTWKGRGTYYYYSLTDAARLMTVTIDVTLAIQQNGNNVTAQMTQKVVKQSPNGGVAVGDAYLYPAEDWSGALTGYVSITDLYLETTSTPGYKDVWTFTFTTDLMSGGFLTEPNGDFYVCKSDVRGFALTRQK